MSFDRSRPVLVVDDNLAVVRIVRMLLNAEGILDVEVASSGPDAIRKLNQKAFGLVISDYVMTPISGRDLRLIMNGREDWAKIPFVLMTSEDYASRARQGMAEGDQVIHKPFTADILLSAIERAARALAA